MTRSSFFLTVIALVGCSKPVGQQGTTALVAVQQAQAVEVRPAFRADIFEPVYRASVELQSAQETGMNRDTFNGLLQKFATEVKIAKDKAESDLEKQVANGYAEALSIYRDAAGIWDVKMNIPDYEYIAEERVKLTVSSVERKNEVINKKMDFEFAIIDGIPLTDFDKEPTGVEGMATKYNLPITEKHGWKIIPHESVSTVMSKAAEKCAEVDKLRKSAAGKAG